MRRVVGVLLAILPFIIICTWKDEELWNGHKQQQEPRDVI